MNHLARSIPSHPIGSQQRTTLGSFLCSALRDELEVDCVIFDGGNIRGAILKLAAGESIKHGEPDITDDGWTDVLMYVFLFFPW